MCRGSVEYVAPKSYCVRDPMESWHIFVVDVTATAMRMGATVSVCAAARAAVEALGSEERARVAVMTFDDRVHFYALKGGTTRMMIMPDIEVLSTKGLATHSHVPLPLTHACMHWKRRCCISVVQCTTSMHVASCATRLHLHLCFHQAYQVDRSKYMISWTCPEA